MKIKNQSDMDKFVAGLGLTSKKVVIKPNWVDGRPGTHTDARVLDMFLSALNRPAVLVESYSFWRTDKMVADSSDYFSSKEATLETGKRHWDFFNKQDKLFLETNGLDTVLKKHKAEFINITNEIWKGNGVSTDIIKESVVKKFGPVEDQDLYAMIPHKLYDLRGSDLISFAKAKKDTSYGASLSIKNIFGLIPDPNRFAKYHGGDDEELLTQSIVDVHKVYQSLFKMTFVVEGVFESCEMNWDTGKSIPNYDWGEILGGKDGLAVDAKINALLGTSFEGPMKDLSERYQKVFR